MQQRNIRQIEKRRDLFFFWLETWAEVYTSIDPHTRKAMEWILKDLNLSEREFGKTKKSLQTQPWNTFETNTEEQCIAPHKNQTTNSKSWLNMLLIYMNSPLQKTSASTKMMKQCLNRTNVCGDKRNQRFMLGITITLSEKQSPPGWFVSCDLSLNLHLRVLPIQGI